MNKVIEMEACTMKKLTFIIILTLLAIAAIFATDKEVHTIRIASVVEEVLPTFQFELTSGMLEEQDAPVLDLNQSGTENPENRRVIYVPDINKNDLDLTFTAKLSNEARCQGSFTLKLTAGDFMSQSSAEWRTSHLPESRQPSRTMLLQDTGWMLSFPATEMR